MSPEQAEGDLDRLGPRSDVYSLGATLYCLLTGQPPLAGDDLGAILRAVQRGEFRPPRQLDATIDPALEAVCLKAMALKSEDRYGSPRALAEDIERWMADEPVSAWREPLVRRARRWSRRNRTLVTTAAAAVVVALAGTAAVLAVQTRANRELRAANEQTRQERDLARHHFELAQQNFVLARKAVDDYLSRVGQNPLLKEQGLHALRQELLEAALGYYRDFLRQRGDDPSLRADAAAAQERVGDIQNELGRFGDALTAYDHALGLIGPLVREHPGDSTVATAQVRIEAGRLQAFGGDGRYPEAIAAFERANQLGEALLAAGEGTEDLPEILARTYDSAAFVFRESKRIDDALRASVRAHALAERSVRDHPGNLSAARTLLTISALAVEFLLIKGDLEQARHLCEQGIAFGKVQVRDHRHDIEMRLHLARLESMLGWVEKSEGRQVEALKDYRSGADTLGALARENPLLIHVRSNWADTLVGLSNVQTDFGRYAEAEQSARASIEVLEALVRDVPSNPYYRRLTGNGYGVLGKALAKRGSRGEALAAMRKAIAILEASAEVTDLVNLACLFALASTVADPAEGPGATERQRRDADRAVAMVRRAIAMGWGNLDNLKNEPDLDSLRSRPDFQLLMMDLTMPADPFAAAP
jgi:serine/threonine-protein kinase